MLKYVYYTYTLCNTFFKNVTIFLCVWKIALTLLFIKSKPGSDLDPVFISSDPAKKIPKPDLIRIWTAAKITTLTNCIVYNVYVAATGGFDMTNTICILSNNLFNMYYFLILWWWWILLVSISFTGLLYRSRTSSRFMRFSACIFFLKLNPNQPQVFPNSYKMANMS